MLAAGAEVTLAWLSLAAYSAAAPAMSSIVPAAIASRSRMASKTSDLHLSM